LTARPDRSIFRLSPSADERLPRKDAVMKKSSFVVAALALLLPLAASAHQIWIESSGKGAKLYFGEFGMNLREVSPGTLDKLPSPAARTAEGEAIALTKAADHYLLARPARKGESLVAEEVSYPSWEDKGKRGVWFAAARWVGDFAAVPARLTLDLVPTGKAGELQVVYKDKPLPGVEVVLVAQSGWEKRAESDKDGKVAFSMPWKGAYLVEVHHTDKTPGKRKLAAGEEKYDEATYVTTLSFSLQKGLAGAPVPPAAPPSKE
jgi:uncharacterized GH25 family protein